MKSEFFFRTEDILTEKILDYMVEIDNDRKIIENLKSQSPIILRGSRGVGKSFLMRMAEAELTNAFDHERILPVYITFARASLIKTPTPEKFFCWMLAKVCNRILRTASKLGLKIPFDSSISALRGDRAHGKSSSMEEIEKKFENAWRDPNSKEVDLHEVPDISDIQDAVEDLCSELRIRRINIFVDEAAHVFIPEQQRQFFTMMRDLRSARISVNAAVYPGATAYGESFQPTHDATTFDVDRSAVDEEYVAAMREMVYKQDSSLQRKIEQGGEVFDTLAYAATGNPRTLLKTIFRTTPFSKRNAQETIKSYYREEIWAEHSALSERYPGHRELIDWGRKFLENEVIPTLHQKNSTLQKRSVSSSRNESHAHIWIHRDAPRAVREAMRLLCYSGILQESSVMVKATRSELGTRYMVNLGCQFALDSDPIEFGTQVRQNLSPRRMIEYGANHATFRSIQKISLNQAAVTSSEALEARLAASVDKLDLTRFQFSKIRELGLSTIGEVLSSNESHFQSAYYVGPARARQIHNAAVAAVLEYLSG